jgi:hypothetical protein
VGSFVHDKAIEPIMQRFGYKSVPVPFKVLGVTHAPTPEALAALKSANAATTAVAEVPKDAKLKKED